MDHLAHNGPRRPFEKMNLGSRLPLNSRGRSKPLRRGRKSANECDLPPISRPMRGRPRQYGVCGMGCWELEGLIKPQKISRWTEVKWSAFSSYSNYLNDVQQVNEQSLMESRIWAFLMQIICWQMSIYSSWPLLCKTLSAYFHFCCLHLHPAA